MDIENKQKYMDGKKNFVARQWYYLLQGLATVDKFKNLGFLILGVYGLARFTNPWLMLIVFLICLPVLLFVGFVNTWYINKVVDFLNTELGTHWGRYTFTLSEKQIKLLEEIKEKIK